MILYLDTSCLVKLYVQETGTELVKKQIEEADVIVASVVAYPEMRAALARRRREKALKAGDYQQVLRQFERDWKDISRVPVIESIAQDAGDLAESHKLRGLDAVHLSTALFLRNTVGNTEKDFRLLTADHRLNEAAKKERFAVERFTG